MREAGRRAMPGRMGMMVVLAVLLVCPILAPAQPADLIIRNGRVIDLESGLDEVRTLVVSGGQIVDVTSADVEAEWIAESTEVFDPSRVQDTATFEGGLDFSQGIEHVLVGGVAVVSGGQAVPDVFPGEAIVGEWTGR